MDLLNLQSNFWKKDRLIAMTSSPIGSFFSTCEAWETDFRANFCTSFSSITSATTVTPSVYALQSLNEIEDDPKQITWILPTGEQYKLDTLKCIKESGLARDACELHKRPGVTTLSTTIFLDKGTAETFAFFRHAIDPETHGNLEVLLTSISPVIPHEVRALQNAIFAIEENGVSPHDSSEMMWLIAQDIHALPCDPVLDLLLATWELTGYLQAYNIRDQLRIASSDCYDGDAREGRTPLYNLKRIWEIDDDTYPIRELVARVMKGRMSHRCFESAIEMNLVPGDLVELLTEHNRGSRRRARLPRTC